MDKIIKQLKEVSDQLEEKIKSAKSATKGLRTSDKDRCQFARMKIQEAIAKLLEIW